MIKLSYLFILILLVSACGNKSKSNENIAVEENMLEKFLMYLTGDFDNLEQLDAQRAAGQVTHPYAKHINRLADHKVVNRPQGHPGHFLLEESYYLYDYEQDTLLKPYLFYFTLGESGRIRLHSYKLPEGLDLALVRNDNPDLIFDFDELVMSSSFTPAEYTWTGEGFYLNAPNELGNGLRFTLEETIYPDKLVVMELLERNGERITPYDSPIIYKRMK